MPTTVRERSPAKSLEADWQFRIDPGDDGVDEAWFDPTETWTDGRTITIPHSWQEIDELRDYTGTAWYRRTVTVDTIEDHGRLLLAFGAVDFETTVWVNGERVGSNEGGYLPFTVDATDALVEGDNTVVLRVVDPEDISELPHGKQGEPWYTRVSGPWQRIDLLTVPETYVADAKVTPDLTDNTATIDLTVHGDAVGSEAILTIERDGATVASTTVAIDDRTTTTTVTIPDADYWTPDNPVLYDLTVELDAGVTVDTYEDYFGMRSVSFDDGDLYLNGEPFAMRGALDQAFYPDTYYRPADLETFEDEIRAAKELGFNLLRKHIKPAHPEFIELADRLGILVWEEPANPKVYSDRSKELFRDQLQGMVDRDYNSPSIIAWSIYNEEWGIGHHEDEEPLWTDEEKQDYLQSLYETAQSWDPTRLFCDNSGWAHVATDLNDYHEYFVAPDRIDAWRDRLDEMVTNPAGNYGDVRTDPEEAPLLVSEFGTWGLTNVGDLERHYDGDPHWFNHDFLEGMKRPGDVRSKFAESHAADVFEDLDALETAWQRREFQSIETIIADMRVHDGVAGYVITELTDIEWEFNGILDYLREEKEFYHDFARVNAPVMLHLEPDSSTVWGGDSVAADLLVVNDTNKTAEFDVTLSGGETEIKQSLVVDGNETRRIEEAVTAEAPTVDELESIDITAEASNLGRTVSRSIVVVPEHEPDVVTDDQLVVATDQDELADALSARGYQIVSDGTAADVTLGTTPSGGDGATLVLPDGDGHMVDTDQLEYTDLPETESWNLCASFVYQDLFEDIGGVPGWAFEGLYPYDYVTDTSEADDVSVGYMEGWLENDGAVVTVREDLAICTLRVTEAYGDHPMATHVVDRLLATLA